jgi:Flp pilus assembly protein TadG
VAEFAMLAPILALLAFGLVDLMLVLRAQGRVTATAFDVGAAVSACVRLVDPHDFDALRRLAAASLDAAANAAADGAPTVIVTAVVQQESGLRQAWQWRSNDQSPSRIVDADGALTLPDRVATALGQVVLVTEVTMPVRPGAFSAALVRFGALPEAFYASAAHPARVADGPVVGVELVEGQGAACLV